MQECIIMHNKGFGDFSPTAGVQRVQPPLAKYGEYRKSSLYFATSKTDRMPPFTIQTNTLDTAQEYFRMPITTGFFHNIFTEKYAEKHC